jgi:ADP-heptose:LPS heptosyltransferase
MASHRQYKKILAIKLRSLGDTVLMTAPLAQLHRAFPNAQIDVAVLTPWAPLLENMPGVTRVWTYDRHTHSASRAKASARLALKLRKEHYDCVVNFHASPSSAMISFATGAKTRSVHFHGHHDKDRYSTLVVPGKGSLKPIIERDMDTVRALGIDILTGLLPQVRPTTSEIQWAQNQIQTSGKSGPVLALGLGASRPTKSWPVDSFVTLAIQWCQKQSGAAVALTGPDENELATRFLQRVDELLLTEIPDITERSKIRSRICCESRFSVRQLSAFLSCVSLFVGNDSGPKHLAVANGTTTLTLFGPEDPFEWHPYPTTLHPYFFIDQLACRKDAQPGMPPWCGLDVCVEEQHKCMKQIGTDSVLAKSIELFSARPSK